MHKHCCIPFNARLGGGSVILWCRNERANYCRFPLYFIVEFVCDINDYANEKIYIVERISLIDELKIKME